MTADRARQWREVLAVKKFPVISWMLAGSCLVGLYFVDLPNRQRQRAEWAAQARQESEPAAQRDESVVQELAGGRVLLADGRIVSRTPRQAPP